MPKKKNPHSVPYVKPDYHSQNKEKLNDNLIYKKLPKLRTSLDIYNRLIHDKTLNIDLENVQIGYTDTILGNQEVCILDWVMIDKGGDIPMHHILYFIFTLNNGNKLILWDRKTKLDRLYCSGVTKPQQALNIILNSKRIINIQSQNINNNNNLQSNDNNNNIIQLNDKNKKKQKQKRKRKRKRKNNINNPNDDQKQNDNNNQIITRIPQQMFQSDHNEMIKKYFPRYPVTNDGFVESFNINDTVAWKKYLKHYGLVVLKVLNDNECDDTVNSMVNEIYNRRLELNQLSNYNNSIHKIDINNPYTWNEYNFPKPHSKFLTDRPAFSKQAFKNRCCAKMYFIFKTIYNDNKLNVTIDNWGIQRGTKNLTFIDPSTGKKLINGYNHEQKKWRKNLVPHWDINPWKYSEWLQCGHYNYLYQGALALSEQRLCDGTHLTLPGCMNFLSAWCEKNKNENVNPYRHNLNINDNIHRYLQPIPLRKGEMVIWNYGQCHANTKNMSNRMRLTQYIRMYPSQQKYIKRDHYSSQEILSKFKKDIDIKKILGNDMNETAQKLFGLASW